MGLRSFLKTIGLLTDTPEELAARRDVLVKDLTLINDSLAFHETRREELLACMERYVTQRDCDVLRQLLACIDDDVRAARTMRGDRGTRTVEDKKVLEARQNDNLHVITVMADKVRRKIETEIDVVQRAFEAASRR